MGKQACLFIYSLSAQEVGKMIVIIGDRVMYSTADGPHQWRRIVRITRHLHYNHHSLVNAVVVTNYCIIFCSSFSIKIVFLSIRWNW